MGENTLLYQFELFVIHGSRTLLTTLDSLRACSAVWLTLGRATALFQIDMIQPGSELAWVSFVEGHRDNTTRTHTLVVEFTNTPSHTFLSFTMFNVSRPKKKTHKEFCLRSKTFLCFLNKNTITTVMMIESCLKYPCQSHIQARQN
jgi:hypothetical protein